MAIRIGVLGCAAINQAALLEPAAGCPDVTITAVAARDRVRAEQYAAKQGIARVLPGYQELIEDEQIDAIYVPLPIALHGAWTIRALRAGKHVLCEKALTANAAEAELVRATQTETGLVMMHAVHNRYHQMLARITQIIAAGELGEISRIEAEFNVPQMPAGDIRWDYDLGGGVTPDIGLYPIDLVRTLAGRQPVVTQATAITSPEDSRVDAMLAAELDFGQGLTGHISGAMAQGGERSQTALVTGAAGSLAIDSYVHPQRGGQLTIRTAEAERTEQFADRPSSYAAQLNAFVAAIRDGAEYSTDAEDAVATMRVIDDCYLAAGLPLRLPLSN